MLGSGGNELQIVRQMDELLVGSPVGVAVTKSSDSQAVLGIHQEISPQIVEHYGVVGGVKLRELAPDHPEGLDVHKPPAVAQLLRSHDRDHRS
eukprot:CAMPEP_0204351464 /NCGR_PEP_ID=MMETSP0469-20131031/31143_1 /ASSEMBLY_ACC=CAM_ASM_000384 /TAXON_ID=2969 /ORGANISM="Oxyrrhis marina" /LENGTH=92 /DNA_ID=CAMNT_0051338019 /DNA_START=114 /DNA_END=391 /DNA_ORIENTATION=+